MGFSIVERSIFPLFSFNTILVESLVDIYACVKYIVVSNLRNRKEGSDRRKEEHLRSRYISIAHFGFPDF